MGHDDVANFFALFGIQTQREAAGINRDTLVDEKTCQTLFGGCVALAIEGAG
jgi:hypothetical protein